MAYSALAKRVDCNPLMFDKGYFQRASASFIRCWLDYYNSVVLAGSANI